MRGFLIIFVILLGGCSSSPVMPPTPLEPVENTVDVISIWQYETGTGAYDHYLKFKPVFWQGKGYVVDYLGLIRAFDISTGETVWETRVDVALSTTPAVTGGRLLLGSNTGDVIALDPDNGKELWRTRVSSEVLAPPQGADDLVIARTIDGRLFALNAETGKQRWVYERSVPLLTLRGNSTPLIVNDMVLLGADSGKLTAITLKDGVELWETAIAIPSGRTELERIIDIDADLVVFDDLVYVVTYQGRLAAVQLDNGRIRWVRDMSSYNGFVVDAYRIYITDEESQVLALNRMNGAVLWRQDKLIRRSLTAPVIFGDNVVVADYDGYVHWLDREDGHIKARKRINQPSFLNEPVDVIYYDEHKRNVLATPVVVDDKLLVNDRFGMMYAYIYFNDL
ncbi:MAG: outer membrane protein assembly factor BamB [Gammaproteobacteria bacterium]|nr:outer membrane protein assembly factor BamB [Gammaproteobacteria bacterium]